MYYRLINISLVNSISRNLYLFNISILNLFGRFINRIKFSSNFIRILNLNLFVNRFRNWLNISIISDLISWNINRFRNNFVLISSRKYKRFSLNNSVLSLYKLRFSFDIFVHNSWLSNNSLFYWCFYSFCNIFRLSCYSLCQYFRWSCNSFCYDSRCLLNFLNLSLVVC